MDSGVTLIGLDSFILKRIMDQTRSCSPLQPPIAIVGIHAELPSGDYSSHNLDYKGFFQFLLEKGEAYERIPSDRFNIDSWRGRGLGQVLPELGVFLKDTAMFDYLEFGITTKDARAMAVSTRKLIESSFLALLDSGIDYRSKNVGCYTSGIAFDINSIADPDEFEARGSFAGFPSMLANRVSYYLDLLGPSIPTDTACSSTLTAIHLAIQGIRSGDCEAAVVSGCQLNHRLMDFIQYSQGSLVCADGKCKPFDASANGFSRAEGVVSVVLKLLDDAIRDGDYIYGSILGTGINTSGSAAPVSAPVAASQVDAMYRAYRGTGRHPSEVDYVELHATGTAAGDPTEANWVGEKFKRDGELLIGSVKGNVGHLEITAFLASLCKVCAMFETRLIPPTVNLRTPNPAIKWKEHRLRVPLDVTTLGSRHPSKRPLVSLMSSGIGGANGHCVIEGPPSRSSSQSKETDPSVPVLLVAGGLSPRSASSIADTMTEFAQDQSTDIRAVSTLYGRRQRQMTWRSFSVVSVDQSNQIVFPPPSLASRVKPPIVFVFAGQGPQHIEMGRQLAQTYPAFRDSIMYLDNVYRGVVGTSLIENTGIFARSANASKLPDIWPIAIILPSIAMVQIAMTDLLRSIGIAPDIVIGHSAGETAMLYAAGACSRDMALEIAIARGKAMSLAETIGGTMAALSCSPIDALAIIKEVIGEEATGKLEIACYNSREAVTLAGAEHYIDKAVERAQEKGYFARKLRTHVPVHSSLMDICEIEYRMLIDVVFSRYPDPCRPQIKTYSTLSGGLWSEEFTPDYFWRNTRMPVMFTQAVSSLLVQFPSATFVEMSPHPALSSYISALGAAPTSVVCPMKREKNVKAYQEVRTFLNCIGSLAVLGYNSIDFCSLNGMDYTDSRIATPPYPFVRKHVAYYPESSTMMSRQLETRHGPLNHKHLKLNSLTHPGLNQHVIAGEAIMPAAGYLEMAFEYGAQKLWNVEFRSMMSLPSDKLLHVEFNVDGDKWSVKSRLDANPHAGRLHADGYMSLVAPDEELEDLDLSALKSRLDPTNITKFYETLKAFGQYGPLFQRVTAMYKGENEALVQIRGFELDLIDAGKYVIHPAILDACFHALVHPALTRNADRNIYYLPARVGMVHLHGLKPNAEIIYAYIRFSSWMPDGLVFDLVISDSQGVRLCSMSGFEVAKHELSIIPSISTRYDLIYQPLGLNIKVYDDSHPEIDLDKGDQTTRTQKQDRLPSNWPSHPQIHNDLILKGLTDEDSAKIVTTALDRLGTSLHKILDIVQSSLTSVVESGQKRMLRILSVSEDISGLLPDLLQSFLHEHGTIYIEYIGCDAPSDSSRLSESFNAHKFTYDYNLSPEEQQLAPNSFDVIVGIHALSPIAETEGRLKALHSLLVPGGILILSDLDGDAWEETTSIPGGRSATGLEHHRYAFTFWQGLHLDVGFSSISQRTTPTSLMPFLILVAQKAPIPLINPLQIQKPDSKPLVLSFIFGEEMHLQHQLSTITPGSIVWIEATADASGGAARGLFRSLRKEMFELDLRLVLFDTSWGPEARISAVQTLSQSTHHYSDSEFVINVDGQITVPRLIPSNPPAERDTYLSRFRRSTLFDSTKAYILFGGIGSLGVRLASWMYQNGARNIILTSRSGKSSLRRSDDIMGLRILRYLESQTDLCLRLESCDVSSVDKMSSMMSRIQTSIAGCLILSAILSDHLFHLHNEESYRAAFPSKAGAFQVIEKTLPIGQLDFLIALSSVATFGNIGQTNYASANALVEEFTRSYPNAFSLVAPAILDTSMVATNDDLTPDSRLAHLTTWAMSSQEIFGCLEDGIMKLAKEPFWLYVPSLNWTQVQEQLGPSSIYDHLVRGNEVGSTAETENPIEAMQSLVLEFLDLPANDFSPDVPFTSYGLDSLSAGRLSFALQPFISITQLQLLADVSFTDLLVRIDKQGKQGLVSKKINPTTSSSKRFDWSALNQSGECIVTLVDGSDIPLILIHGFSGNIVAFMPLQERFTTTLWAIQTTPETPIDSIFDMAIFYADQIKIARPNGPYRLGGFSASSLLTFEVARVLEGRGDRVVQLALMDHFPTLFTSPLFELDDESLTTKKPSQAVVEGVVRSICECYQRDYSPARRKLAEELDAALNGLPVRDYIKGYFEVVDRMTSGVTRFLIDIAGPEPTREVISRALVERLKTVKAPVTMYLAARGIGPSIPEPRAGWEDLGCRACFPDARLVSFNSSHFEMFETEEVLISMQTEWHDDLYK